MGPMEQREAVRRLVESDHIEPVIRELAVICRERATSCRETPEFQAIGKEWAAAARYLDKAADVVEQ